MRANELQLQKDRFSYLPNLALFGTWSYAAYGNTFSVFDRSQDWFPTSIVGLKMNVPVFSGFQRMYRVKEDKIGVLESEATLNNIKEGIYLEVSNSLTSLENALADLKNQQENMDLAQNVEHDSKIKYEAGTGSNIEVVDAETSLTEAETNYYNALFNALVAKVDYEQAKGTLYNK
jgi:outer membrane protein TolC